jgi:hypothetical protein
LKGIDADGSVIVKFAVLVAKNKVVEAEYVIPLVFEFVKRLFICSIELDWLRSRKKDNISLVMVDAL